MSKWLNEELRHVFTVPNSIQLGSIPVVTKMSIVMFKSIVHASHIVHVNLSLQCSVVTDLSIKNIIHAVTTSDVQFLEATTFL